MLQVVAVLDQVPGVAGEARQVAGDVGDAGHAARGQGLDLRGGTGPRRIEDDEVEGRQLLRRQRPPVQVAGLDGEAGPGRSPAGRAQGCRQRRVTLDRMHGKAAGEQAPAERTEAGIRGRGHGWRRLRRQHGLDDPGFAERGRLKKGAGRHGHDERTERDAGRAPDDQWLGLASRSAPGDPGEVELVGQLRCRLRSVQGRRADRLDPKVDAGFRGSRATARSGRGSAKAVRPAGRADRRSHGRLGQRDDTLVDRHDLVPVAAAQPEAGAAWRCRSGQPQSPPGGHWPDATSPPRPRAGLGAPAPRSRSGA